MLPRMGHAIILGYDGSACADGALGAAAAEAARTPGSTVIVVHCYELPGPYPTPVGLEPPSYLGGWSENQRRAVVEAAEAVTRQAVARLEELGIRAEGVTAEGRASEALIAAAQEREAVMIVVGTHGEGVLAGALLGSTAYRLVHRSPVPVLIVPPVDRC